MISLQDVVSVYTLAIKYPLSTQQPRVEHPALLKAFFTHPFQVAFEDMFPATTELINDLKANALRSKNA